MKTGTDILIVENQHDIRFALTLSLQSAGYHVVAVESMEAATTMLDNDSSHFDLLIVDFQLETMRCTRFAAQLRQRHADLPILLLVGTRCKKEIAQLHHIEKMHVVQKPLDRQQLLATVRHLLPTPERASTSD